MVHESSSSDSSNQHQKVPSFEHVSIASTKPTINSSIHQRPTSKVAKRYTNRAQSVSGSISSDASHYESDVGELEDFNGVQVSQIDRYGFLPEAPERRRRRSATHHTDASPEQKKQNRQSVLLSIKRASDNIGLTEATDYLENPQQADETILIAKESERSEKWRSMAHRNDATLPFEFTVTSKTTDRVYKGIPDCWRSSAWQSFLIPPENKKDARLRAKIRRRETEVDGAEDLEVRYKRHGLAHCEFDGQIDLDVPRTISGHVLFRRRYSGGQRLLFRVLHAISLEYPMTGYVQGMASVAATLLCYYPEEQAFVMMTHLWSVRQLARLYEPGFPHLLASFKSLEGRMQKTRVGRHLLAINVQPMNFATRWYLTLFHVSLPFRTQLRVWDVFMLHKPSKTSPYAALEATTLAILEGMEVILLQSDFEQAMSILTTQVAVKDDDRLLKLIRKKMKH